MSTVTDERTYRTTDVARALGVAHTTVWRFASRWYPGVGQGARIRVNDTDVMVLRAYIEINARRTQCPDHNSRWLLSVAESAVRADPRRWLLVGRGQASTFDDAETAGEGWLHWPRPRAGAWLIDLVPDIARFDEMVE